MALPIATTTIAIKRPPEVDDNGDAIDSFDPPADPVTVATGIRAVIGSGSGSADREGSNRSESSKRLTADPCDLRANDLVFDERAGLTYRVQWTDSAVGLGLDHRTADLIFAG